jgi:hypothetical protein
MFTEAPKCTLCKQWPVMTDKQNVALPHGEYYLTMDWNGVPTPAAHGRVLETSP